MSTEYSDNQVITILNAYANLIESMNDWKSAQTALNRVNVSAIPGMKEIQENYIKGIENTIRTNWQEYSKIAPDSIRARVGYCLDSKELERIILSD